jgi:hypothetical protein
MEKLQSYKARIGLNFEATLLPVLAFWFRNF